MATIVGALGTSHSPQLSMPSSGWPARAEWDRTTPLFSFADAAARAPEGIVDELTPEAMEAKHQRCQAAIDELHRTYVELAPDVVVVVGDDQSELFLDDVIPAFAVVRSETLTDLPRPLDTLHPSSVPAEWAYHGEQPVDRPGHPELGRHLVGALSDAGFDVAQVARQHEGRSLGHAFTFVHRRVLVEPIVPMVPVLVNTDHPPNVPTPARCLAFGRALRQAIDTWNSEARVVLVASGGLSHFEVDASLDRHVLDSIAGRDEAALAALDPARLVLGTSEIRNWVVVAAALGDDHAMQLVDYVPAYRSEAATGCGMAFATWRPTAPTSPPSTGVPT